MVRSGWQGTWVRIVTTALTLAVMVMIFCFSMETAEDSDKTSGAVSLQVVRVLHPEYDQMEEQARKGLFESVQHVVRKCAHFTEYMVLGFAVRLCLESWFGHRMKKYRFLAVIGFAAGTAYACTDEAHQLAIDGRSGQWTDVLVDAGGVLIGVTLGTMLIKSLSRKNSGKDLPEMRERE